MVKSFSGVVEGELTETPFTHLSGAKCIESIGSRYFTQFTHLLFYHYITGRNRTDLGMSVQGCVWAEAALTLV